MKVLTKENALELLGGESLDTFVSELSSRLHLVGDTYSIPRDAGRKTALSRVLAYLLLRKSSVSVYVSGWGVWGSSENLDLFYGYRRSFGEKRPLIDAPVHLFEPTEEDTFISVLCMVFFFSWDASVFDLAGRSLLQTSHDGWLEVRTSDRALVKDVAVELEKYRVPLLAR